MTTKPKVVVLGGGIGGLAVAYYLSRTGQYQVTLLEKEPVVGGLCASFEHQGFTLDYGAHKLYSTIPGIMDEISAIFDGRIRRVPKRNKVFLRNNLLEYPLKLSNLGRVLGLPALFRLGAGFILETLKGLVNRSPALSYEDYMIKRFGKPAYELVFAPLADKVWGNPASLHADMARTRVPASGGFDIILKLLGLKKETIETNAEFFLYPDKGFGAFPRHLQQKIEQNSGRVLVSAAVRGLIRDRDRVIGVTALVNGSEQIFPCDYLVSTIPLPDFARLLLAKQYDEIKSRDLILVYLFIERDSVLQDQWIFFPEKEYIFSRIFEQKQMDPTLGPKDQTAICCDFTCDQDSWQWQATDDELADKCLAGLVKAGFVKPTEVKGRLVKRFSNFYPRYDLGYEDKLLNIINEIKNTRNVLLSGRVGMYNYNNCDHCLDMALFIKERLAAGIAPPAILDALLLRVKEYKIVD
jgi:protoporphyrinogen oxidase